MSEPCCTTRRGGRLLVIVAVVGLIFGVATVMSGGKVIFGDDAARTAVGDYIPFIVWSNFLLGFAYIGAALGLLWQARWAAWLALAIVGVTAITFAAFAVHIATGGAFEMRTVAAMSLRLGVWLMIASLAWRALVRNP